MKSNEDQMVLKNLGKVVRCSHSNENSNMSFEITSKSITFLFLFFSSIHHAMDAVQYQLSEKIARLKLISNDNLRRINGINHLETSSIPRDSFSSANLPLIAVTGGWDAEDSNEIALYSIPSLSKDVASLGEPQRFSSLKSEGEIIDLLVWESKMNQESPLIIFNNSKGFLSVCSVGPSSTSEDPNARVSGDISLELVSKISLHNRGGSSSLALHSDKREIASGGEDGHVFLLDEQCTAKRNFVADSLSIYSLLYLSRDSLLTASLASQLKRWDLRQSDRPTEMATR